MPSPDPLATFLARLPDAKQHGDHWQSRCPGHQDKSPSLSISRGTDGRVLLKDFAGCTVEVICAAVGLTPADLFPHNEKQGTREIRYAIKDTTGKLIATHIRKDLPDGSKTFVWETDGKSGLAGRRVDSLPLYRSEKLVLAMSGETVYVTEGEKAADALATLGVNTVATVCGANTCPTVATLKPYAKYNLVLWPDNDEPGLKHMQVLARAAVEAGANVLVLEWPKAKAKEDAADFVSRGGTAEGLATLKRSPYTVEDAWQADLGEVLSGDEESVGFAPPDATVEPGGRIVITWSDVPVRVLLEQVERRKDGLHCFFAAQRRHKETWKWLTSRSRQNLYSISARESLVRDLEATWSVKWKERIKQTVIAADEALAQSTPVLTLADAADPGERVSLLYPLLEVGEISILFADGGTGKSLFAMAVACSLAANTPLLPGLSPTKPCPVLYLDWETSPQEQRRRMGQITGGAGLTIPRNLYYRRMSGPLGDSLEQLREFIRVNNVVLVVADSAGYATDGDINDATVALTFAAAVRALESTTLVIAHVPREKENRDRPIGSTYFHNMARSTWLLVKEQDSGQQSVQLGLINKKSNNGPLHPAIAFRVDFSDNAVRYYRADPQATPNISANTSEADQIAAVLARGAMTVANILEELGLAPGKAGQVRKTLVRRKDLFIRVTADARDPLWGLVARQARQENGVPRGVPRETVNDSRAATPPYKGGANAAPSSSKQTGDYVKDSAARDDPAAEKDLPWE